MLWGKNATNINKYLLPADDLWFITNAALPGLRTDRSGQWLIIVFVAWCCATFQPRYPETLSALSHLWSTEPNAWEPCHIVNRNAFPLTVSRHSAALAMSTLHCFWTRIPSFIFSKTLTRESAILPTINLLLHGVSVSHSLSLHSWRPF